MWEILAFLLKLEDDAEAPSEAYEVQGEDRSYDSDIPDAYRYRH